MDNDTTAYIPLSTYTKMYNDGDKVGFFAIVSKPEANLETVEEQAKLELKKKNNVSPEDTNAFGSFNLGKMFGKMYGFLNRNAIAHHYCRSAYHFGGSDCDF